MSHSTLIDTFLPIFLRPSISWGSELRASYKLSTDEEAILSVFSFFYMLSPRIVLHDLYHINLLQFQNPK